MYNSFIFFCKKTDKSIKFLLSKEEFNEIKKLFFWSHDSDNFIFPEHDYFTDLEILKFKSLFKSICEDFFMEDYYVSFNQGIYFTSTNKIFHDKFYPLTSGICEYNYQQIVPLNGRPTFEYDDKYILEWFFEFGIYLKYDKTKCLKKWFVHPKTNFFLFKDLVDFEKFIKKNKSEMEKAKLKSESSNLFIRVINVYDSKTKNLKYRIINEEFYTSGLDSFIKPFPGDEVYFLRSYKVTLKIANYIHDMFNNNLIDFDFERNEYYLEVLSADHFLCSYKEFSEGL